jgi:hypothetical protein
MMFLDEYNANLKEDNTVLMAQTKVPTFFFVATVTVFVEINYS